METLVKELQDKLFEEFKSHKSRGTVYSSARKLERENNLQTFSLYNKTLRHRCDEWDTTPSKGILSRCWPY